ncbi:MAG TPA: hypothetical protein VIG48_13385 [Jatrophihabitans sp.]
MSQPPGGPPPQPWSQPQGHQPPLPYGAPQGGAQYGAPQYGPPQRYPQPYGPQFPQQYPPKPPKGSLAPLFIALGLVVVAAVVIGIVVLVNSGGTATAGSRPAATAGGPTLSPQRTLPALKTACTHALAKDMAALVPNHEPFRDQQVSAFTGFQLLSCNVSPTITGHEQVFRSLNVDISRYLVTSGLPAPQQRCAAELATRARALRSAGNVMRSVPNIGDRTIGAVEKFNGGAAATVAACRGDLEIDASYRLAPLQGPAPSEAVVLTRTTRFLRAAFADLKG